MGKNINVKVKEETFKKLCDIAESQEVTLSHLMRQIVKEYLEKVVAK